MEIKRKRKPLRAPGIGMRGANSVEDPNLRNLLQTVQSNLYAIEGRLQTVESRVAEPVEEPEQPEREVQKPYDSGGATGEFGRVIVSNGHVTDGTEEIEEVTTFPAIPERYTLIAIEDQIWAAGPDDTAWYPVYKFTDTEGEPETTP